MRIHFEDHGQDFLRWEVNSDGVVTDSFPFQARFWRGCRVLRHTELAIGDRVVYLSPSGARTNTIRYPIAKIDRETGT